MSEALEKFGCDVSKQVEISREINRIPKSLHQYCSALRVEALSRLQLSIQRLMQMQKSEKLYQFVQDFILLIDLKEQIELAITKVAYPMKIFKLFGKR